MFKKNGFENSFLDNICGNSEFVRGWDELINVDVNFTHSSSTLEI